MKGSPSQQFVPIKTIRDGIIFLGNNEYRALIMVSSLNLSLKGEEEQEAILSQFQNFFNSLDFPIQIFCKSRRVDITPYIMSLEDRLRNVDNPLLKLQIVEYIAYIKSFTQDTNIMNKQFYVVVPYTSSIASGAKNLFSFGSVDKNEANLAFENAAQQIGERVSMIRSGLGRCGLKTTELDTEASIQLFYELFNPGKESKALV
jgi:hypothetical protein